MCSVGVPSGAMLGNTVLKHIKTYTPEVTPLWLQSACLLQCLCTIKYLLLYLVVVVCYTDMSKKCWQQQFSKSNFY